jgi:hypothetical protein
VDIYFDSRADIVMTGQAAYFQILDFLIQERKHAKGMEAKPVMILIDKVPDLLC